MMDALQQFHLLRPWWLLALPMVLALAWHYRRNRDPARQLGNLIAPQLLKHLLVAPQGERRIQPAPLLLLLAMLTLIALSGPSWRKQPSPFASEDAVLMLVLHVTDSMQSGDLSPSRMQRAQHKIHDLLALRQGARAGLIAYAGSAHRVTPATADTRILEQMAAALEPAVMPREGDALDRALRLAQTEIKRSGGHGAIVVITDSINPAQQTALAALAAKDQSNELPAIQFLAPVASAATAAQTGVRRAADQLDAPLTLLSADDSDVQAINRRITSHTLAVLAEGEQWRDDGWLLLPLIALGLLAWSVKGWSVEWS